MQCNLIPCFSVCNELAKHASNPCQLVWRNLCGLFIIHIIDFNWYWNDQCGVHLYLILLPKFATTCFFFFWGLVLSQAQKHFCSDTLDSRGWWKKTLFGAYKKPCQVRNTVSEEDHQCRNLISTAQCVTKQSLWLTFSVLLTLIWWYIFLDRHNNTYCPGGYEGALNTEVYSIEHNLSVTWIILVQLAKLSSLNH